MISEDLTSKMMEFVSRTANSLIARAKFGQGGAYWRIDDLGRYYYDQSSLPNTSLYYGASGILLFFLELYRFKRESKYLPVLHDVSGWLFEQTLIKQTVGFYGGRFGIVYAFIEMHKTLADSKYLNWNNELICSFEHSHNLLYRNGLFNGVAGEILGLVHAINETSNTKAWEILEQHLKLLFDRAKTSDKGIYWDDSDNEFEKLTFLNGNLGIAYALKQLSLLTKDEVVSWCLKQSLNFYDETKLTEGERRDVNWNSWNAFVLLHEEPSGNLGVRAKMLDQASDRLSSNYIEDGLAGIGLFALEIYKQQNDRALLEFSIKIANRIVLNLEKERTAIQPPGLFNGDTGICYFFLKLLNIGNTLINPHIDTTGLVERGNRFSYAMDYWLNKSFQNTVALAKSTLTRETYHENFEQGGTLDSPPVIYLKKLVGDKHNSEILEIESLRESMEENLMRYRNELFEKTNKAKSVLDKKNALSHTFRINPHSQIVELTANAKIFFEAEQLLICLTSHGCRIYRLNQTEMLLVEILQGQFSSLRKQLKNFMTFVEHSAPKDKNTIENFFISQMKLFALQGMIFCEPTIWQKAGRRIKSIFGR